jgi:hypothetical protein
MAATGRPSDHQRRRRLHGTLRSLCARHRYGDQHLQQLRGSRGIKQARASMDRGKRCAPAGRADYGDGRTGNRAHIGMIHRPSRWVAWLRSAAAELGYLQTSPLRSAKHDLRATHILRERLTLTRLLVRPCDLPWPAQAARASMIGACPR